jgi:hypothetical protein
MRRPDGKNATGKSFHTLKGECMKKLLGLLLALTVAISLSVTPGFSQDKKDDSKKAETKKDEKKKGDKKKGDAKKDSKKDDKGKKDDKK